jgi:hydrogenase maturation protease
MKEPEDTARTTPRVLVIGVGNAYRRDDAVGLVAAQRLREAVCDHVTVRQASGEGTALMELWKDADTVVLIDAVHSGGKPGTVHRFDAQARPIPVAFFHSSTHAFSVADAIELARTLKQLPPHFSVYGVEGQTFAAGVGLSPAVEQAVETLIERVRQEIGVTRRRQGNQGNRR